MSLILERNSKFKKPDLQNWAIHLDRMIRIDKRDPAEIFQVIQWCQADDFWQNNILSTEKLRKQYDQLAMKMKKSNTDKTALGLAEWLKKKKEQATTSAFF